jgi:aspartate/methionine/tyrosine aminotransferase
MSVPEATFYAFFSFEGENDNLELAKRIVPEAHVGLAPGSAFGPGGEGFLSLYFACSKDTQNQALDRLTPLFS